MCGETPWFVMAMSWGGHIVGGTRHWLYNYITCAIGKVGRYFLVSNAIRKGTTINMSMNILKVRQ